MSKDSSSNYHQRLHALDATTGAELHNGPVDISAKYPGTGDNSSGGFVIFDPAQYKERAGLLLIGHTVYLAWASHCDIRPYTGWIMGYNATTLAQTTVLNVTPNGNEGAIWGAGAGMAADATGNIFLLDANGRLRHHAECLRISRQRRLRQRLSQTHHHRRTRRRRLFRNGQRGLRKRQRHRPRLRRNSSGHPERFHRQSLAARRRRRQRLPTSTSSTAPTWANSIPRPTSIYQELSGVLPGGIWSMPAAYNDASTTAPSAPPFSPSNSRTRSCSPSPSRELQLLRISRRHSQRLRQQWTERHRLGRGEHQSRRPSRLQCRQLCWRSTTATRPPTARDHFGAGNKYITPTIANGKVYVGTTNGVGVFGLLSRSKQT